MVVGSNSKILQVNPYKFVAVDEKLSLNLLIFVNKFVRSLGVNNVLVSDCFLVRHEGAGFSIKINCFFSLTKTKRYKQLLTKSNVSFPELNDKKILENLCQTYMGYSKTRPNSIFFSVLNLNKSLDTLLVLKVHNFCIKYGRVLFARRFDLFLDFVKISSLLLEKRVSGDLFLAYLGKIFRVLPKRKHSRFILFVKSLFEFLVSNNKNILGFKFILSGKILGKLRSSTSKIKVGRIPLQTIELPIGCYKSHVYTVYGCFGLKLYVNYKE